MLQQISTASIKMVMECSTITKLPMMPLMQTRIVSFLLMNTQQHVLVEILAILPVMRTLFLVVWGRLMLDMGRNPLGMGMLFLVVLGRLMLDMDRNPLVMGTLFLVVLDRLMVDMDKNPQVWRITLVITAIL